MLRLPFPQCSRCFPIMRPAQVLRELRRRASGPAPRWVGSARVDDDENGDSAPGYKVATSPVSGWAFSFPMFLRTRMIHGDAIRGSQEALVHELCMYGRLASQALKLKLDTSAQYSVLSQSTTLYVGDT